MDNVFHCTARKRKRSGFTLIELLVVVLIVSILMAVSAPMYISTVADAQKKTCRSNMQTISNAVVTARIKANVSNYSTLMGPVTSAAEPDLLTVPLCPAGGAYTITTGSTGTSSTFQVNCSATGHGKFEVGIDTN